MDTMTVVGALLQPLLIPVFYWIVKTERRLTRMEMLMNVIIERLANCEHPKVG